METTEMAPAQDRFGYSFEGHSLQETLAEFKAAIEFILTSTMVTMDIPMPVLDANGRSQAKRIQAPMMHFFVKAMAHGKTTLSQLTPDDFADELNGNPSGIV